MSAAGRPLVRVAVVGVGEMGRNHARVYSGLKGAELIGVVDADRARAQAVADANGCEVLGSVDELIGQVDAVSVAVPSALHAPVGTTLLRAGIHCLIEKPLALAEPDCLALSAASDEGGGRLLVGHIERFNPAVAQLRDILADDHAIYAFDARRMSAVSSRVTDIDVTADLMVHDIDIVLSLAHAPVTEVQAAMAQPPGRPAGDHVTAVLCFEGGATATFTASRVTQNKVRELQVTTDRRFFVVDYSSQELHVYRQGRIGPLGADSPDDGRYVLDVGTERVFVRRSEPLAVELAHFLDVARGDAEPQVTAADALAALRIVWEIQRQIGVRASA